MTRDWKEDSMPHVDEGTLHAYLDGELPSSERAAVEAHLAECATCRATLAEEWALLERASALLGSARPVERPAPPFEQIRRSPKRSPWRVRTPFAWAASIMVALGLGYYLRNPGNDASSFAPPPQSVVIAQDRAAPAVPAPANNAPREEPRAGARRELERTRQPESRTDEVAERDARAETPAAATGAIAQLKATPTLLDTSTPKPPLVLDQVVVTAAPAERKDLVSVRGRSATTQWQVISRGTARTLLGTDPVGLPDLATRSIRRSPAPDATVVVEQALDSATVIQIFQRPAETAGYYIDGAKVDTAARAAARLQARAPAAAAREMAPADRLARFVGRLRVEIAGPLSPDSLNRLLELVEPLP
jgi:anti-sigma factor RsiW